VLSVTPRQICKSCLADHQFVGRHPAAQMQQQQPRCSGRLRFEPMVVIAANGTLVDANIAAASAWLDVPEAGEEQQQLVGKAAFNLAYEKVSQNARACSTTQGNGAAPAIWSWTRAFRWEACSPAIVTRIWLAYRAAACPDMIVACSRPWGMAQEARHSR
jgi:hypothetical protein